MLYNQCRRKINFHPNEDGYSLPLRDEWLITFGDKEKIPSSIHEMGNIAWFDLNSSNLSYTPDQKKYFCK